MFVAVFAVIGFIARAAFAAARVFATIGRLMAQGVRVRGLGGRGDGSVTMHPGGVKTTIRVKGLGRLQGDFANVHAEALAEINKELKTVADRAARDAASLAAQHGIGSAAAFRGRVGRPTSRGQWARVQRDKRRTTGQHPEFAPFLYRTVMEPTAEAYSDDAEKAARAGLERALKRRNL
jgi:hypothetical protein